MRFILVLAGALLMSACGPDGSANAVDNGAKGAPPIQLPLAGRYKITEISELTGATPGVPGQPSVTEACLPDQTERDLLTTSGMNCTPEQVRLRDGELSAIMLCTAPGTDVQDARLDYRGSYSANGAEVTGDVVMPQGMIRQTRTLERLGDC